MLVVGAGVFGYTYYSAKKILDDPTDVFASAQETIPPEKQQVKVIDAKTGEEETKTIKDNIILFGLFGVDSNLNRQQRRMGGRTDTMIVVVVDTERHTAKMISCPRDTKTNVKRLDKNGNVIEAVVNKLNAAFPFGGEHGYENTMDAISELFQLKDVAIPRLTKFAGIDMDGIQPVADAVDGVPVKLVKNMSGYGKAGETVILKGQKAEDFVRARKTNGMTSDIDRGNNQKQFVTGIAKRIKEMGATEAVLKLYDKLTKYIDTNMGSDEILALASVLKDIDLDEIEFLTLPGKAVGGNPSYYVLNEEELRKMIIEVFYEDDAPVSQSSPTD